MSSAGVKKPGSILVKFAVIFLAFTLLLLFWTGFAVHSRMNAFYDDRAEEDARRVSAFLRNEIVRNSRDFQDYMGYMRAHRDEIVIPPDFTEYRTARIAFEKAFAEAFPGKVYGTDVFFDDLTEELKNSFTVYMHEYFLLLFEHVRDDFHMAYTCYVIPTGEGCYVEYAIDMERLEDELPGGGKKLHLLDLCEDNREEIPVFWDTWESGEPQKAHDVFNNEYGETYGYYLPLLLDGRVQGILCVDTDLTEQHRAVWADTAALGGMIAGAMVICLVLLLLILHRRYISRIVVLQNQIREYSRSKEPDMAREIRESNRGGDEISALTGQVADMVSELDTYMKNLVSTTHELSDVQKRADEMNELAMNDALTGLKNRTAYEKTVERLDRDIGDDIARFGLVMIDMNDLKKINDRYGHEQGNDALIRLSGLICRVFSRSPVYRIGGDEFIVVAENRDLEDVYSLVERFEKEIAGLQDAPGLSPWERVAAAVGVARFEGKRDRKTEDVFRRADAAMYEDKQRQKAGR